MDATRRQLLRAALAAPLLAAPALLAGCRVRPLYGSFNPEGPLESYRSSQDLQAIHIAPISDRPGQQLHNALRNRLTPRGLPANPAYLLETALSESVGERLLADDATATRAQLRLTARYNLKLASDGTTLYRGSASTLASYNIVETEYATYRAELDARERAIDQLADQMQARLASWFIEARADGTLARKLYIGE